MHMPNDDIRKELREIAPELEKFSGSNPFVVPQGFFGQMPESIAEKIHQRKRRTPREIFLLVLRPVAVAATLFAIAFAALFFLYQSGKGDLLSEHDNLIYEEYLAWYSDYQTDIYLDMVMDDTSPEEVVPSDDFIIEYILDYHGDGIDDLLD